MKQYFKYLIVLACFPFSIIAQPKLLTIKAIINKPIIDNNKTNIKNTLSQGDTIIAEIIFDKKLQQSCNSTYSSLSCYTFEKGNQLNVFSKGIQFNTKPIYPLFQFDSSHGINPNIIRMFIHMRGCSLPKGQYSWGSQRIEIYPEDTNKSNQTNPSFLLDRYSRYNSGRFIVWGEINLNEYWELSRFEINASIFSTSSIDLLPTNTGSSSLSTISTPKQSLSLSPNPSTTGLFHIEGGSNASSLKVYNLHGKAITPLFPDERTLDLSSFPKGMYFVYSSLDGVICTQKLLME